MGLIVKYSLFVSPLIEYIKATRSLFRGDIVIRDFFGDIYTEIPYYITPIIVK